MYTSIYVLIAVLVPTRYNKKHAPSYIIQRPCPYDIMLLGSGSSDDVQMDLWKHSCFNTPSKQLRLSSSTRPPAASLWRRVPPTQQPYDLPAKERVPCPTRRAGSVVRWPPGDESARSPGWRRIVQKWKSQHDTLGINSACTHACPGVRVLLYCCSSTSWVGG